MDGSIRAWKEDSDTPQVGGGLDQPFPDIQVTTQWDLKVQENMIIIMVNGFAFFKKKSLISP